MCNAVKLVPPVLRPGNSVLVYFQDALDRVFSSRLNPMHNLGAIGYFFFWALLGTGLYLYLFYDMSVEGAYNSVQRITENQKYYGGIIRSAHRYASAGLVLVAALHMLQTLFSDRFRKYRWLAWVSGVAILPFIWLEGLTGYAMVFDEKGKMASIKFAEWLDVFPMAVEPFSRNFIQHGSLSTLFFFVLTYSHLTIPIIMLVALWVHCMRISRPLIHVPKELAVALGLLLLAVSVALPAVSEPVADLTKLVASTDMDWFYLFPFPLVDALSASAISAWLFSFGALALLSLLPWMIRGSKEAAAIGTAPAMVDLAHCTGCELCQKACPFEAIDIKPRSDGRNYPTEVEILPERCASCGLCLPACPFPALSIGTWTHDYFVQRFDALFSQGGKGKTMLFVCERVVSDMEAINALEGCAVMVIPCMGILGARAIAASLKHGANGVVVAACVSHDSHYRLSQRKLDLTKVEIGNIKRLKVIEATLSDPDAMLDGIRQARAGFQKEEA